MNPYQQNMGINFGATPNINYGPMPPKPPTQSYANLGGMGVNPSPSVGPGLGAAPNAVHPMAAGMSAAGQSKIGDAQTATDAMKSAVPNKVRYAQNEIDAYLNHVQNSPNAKGTKLADFVSQMRQAAADNPYAGAPPPPPAGGITGAAGNAAAKGWGSRMLGFAGKVAGPLIGAGLEASKVNAAAKLEGMDKGDMVGMGAESLSRLAGAGLGGTAGAALGPVGALAGGVAGYMAPEGVQLAYKQITGKDVELPSEQATRLQGEQDYQARQTAEQKKIDLANKEKASRPVPEIGSSEPNPPQDLGGGVTHFNNAPAKDLLPDEKGTLSVPARAGRGMDSQAVPQKYAGGKGPTMPGVTGYDAQGKPIYPGEGPANYSINEEGNVEKSGSAPMSGTVSQGGMFGEDWKKNALQPSQSGGPVYAMPMQNDYSEAIGALLARAGQGMDMSSLGSMIKSSHDRKAAIAALNPLIHAQTSGQGQAMDYAAKMAGLGEAQNRTNALAQYQGQKALMDQMQFDKNYQLEQQKVQGDPRRQLYDYAQQLSVAKQMAHGNPNNAQMQQDLAALEEQYKMFQGAVHPQYLEQIGLGQQ